MTKKRILLLSSEFPPGPGGIGTHASKLCDELHALGWQFKVCTEQTNLSKEAIERFNGQYHSKVYNVFPMRNRLLEVRNVTLMLWLVLRFRPKIIIGSGKFALWYAALLSKLTSVDFAAILHGTELCPKNEYDQIRTQKALKQAKKMIAVSNYTKSMLPNVGRLAEEATTIYNGGDDRHFFPMRSEAINHFKQENGLNKNSFSILTVGNVSKRKGQHIIIEALPEVLKEDPNVHYYILGLSSEKERFNNRAKELGVEQNVHFLGRGSNDEIVNWMNACDLFAVCSTSTKKGEFEGFGIVVIEAALCKKAAIVSDNSGLAEAVVHEETGICVKQADPKATAAGIIRLLKNRNLLNEYSNNARERATDSFSWEKIAALYHAEFLKMC